MTTTPLAPIASIATPAGRGGIGVVRISGGDLSAILTGVCRRASLPVRQAVFTKFHGDGDEVIDEGIALYFSAPHSYTGENVLELQGHGGVAVMNALLSRCVALGARLAEPGEYTKRAFLNGKLDLAQAEAVADLIDAETTAAAHAAARSLTGAFSKEVDALAAAMIDARVQMEGSLDFPDEELDSVVDAKTLSLVPKLRDQVAALLERAKSGATLRNGITAVLIGAPNVGKSSLLNRLAREEAAIVTPYAGTTRDAIERRVAIDGIPLTIVDTAGLRETDDPIEKIGIERAWKAIERADIAIAMSATDLSPSPLDGEGWGEGGSASNAAILSKLPSRLPVLRVLNKCDLLESPLDKEGKSSTFPLIPISAKTGFGIDALERAILDALHILPANENTFIARERHLDALRQTLAELDLAVDETQRKQPAIELVAEQLRRAHAALCQITGEFAADDLLGEIFSRFCIGK